MEPSSYEPLVATGDSRSLLLPTFVAFAESDRAWVQGFLIPGLGAAEDAVHTKDDLALGAQRVAEAERLIASARLMIVVLSPAFLDDEWSTYAEILAAHSEVSDHGRGLTVVPVILKPCRLPLHLDAKVALDCIEQDSWEANLDRLRTLLNRPPPPQESEACPYPGLAAFDAENHGLFFGREQETMNVLRRAHRQPLLVVVGPSGIGKSSLLHAGLLPRLTDETEPRWLIRQIRPTPTPYAVLHSALSAAADGPLDHRAAVKALLARETADRLLLVVDQFENVFTQASSTERGPFLAALRQLRSARDCCMVVAVRADFYGELMTSPLWPVVESERLDVGPLAGKALESAIVQPATAQRIFLEPVLVERLLRDCADEPGALSLLQETLVLLWRERTRRLLTLASYEELAGGSDNGLSAALRLHADAALAELSPAQQNIALHVLVRLVQHGEGRAPTRRRQRLEELETAGPQPAEVTAVVEHLARHRILTLDASPHDSAHEVNLAHEALITHWPVLQRAVEESQAEEVQRRRLEFDAQQWAESKDAGRLYRGHRLREAWTWSRNNARELSTTARRFLRRSRRRQVVAVASVTTLVALALLGTGSWAVPGLQRTYWRSAAGKLNPPIALSGGELAAPELSLQPTILPALGIDRHEVTNAQYRYCVRANRCNEPRESSQERSYSHGGPTMPVVNVSAVDAESFCSFIGRRLPTAPEWLWAATSGTGRPYPWGKARPTRARANLRFPDATEPGKPVPVDRSGFTAGRTPEGVEHLLGNVQEWVATEGTSDDEGKVHLSGNWDLRDGAAVLTLMGGSYNNDPAVLTNLVLIAEASFADDVSGFRCITDNE